MSRQIAIAYGLFTEYIILSQAGKNQISKGNSKPEWQKYIVVNSTRFSPSGVPYTMPVRAMIAPYGDDPRDQMWIKEGFNFWYRNFK